MQLKYVTWYSHCQQRLDLHLERTGVISITLAPRFFGATMVVSTIVLLLQL